MSEKVLDNEQFPLKVAISGVSGFVGQHLKKYLESKGCSVVGIQREDLENKGRLIFLLQEVDVVINLAGENIGSRWWTKKKKKQILQSRVFATRAIVEALNDHGLKEKVFISASAVGFYGNQAKVRDENHKMGSDFLSQVCNVWEQEANKYKRGRVVTPRFGVVLSKDGGMLEKLFRLAKFGLGGKIGSGKHKMSFIAIEDLVRILFLCMVDKGFEGAINVTTPQSVSNKDFTQLLSKVTKRSLLLPMPKWIVSLFFGEKGRALLLMDQDIFPQKLCKFHYEYLYPTLEQILFKR